MKTDQEVLEAVEKSKNIKQLLTTLGLSPRGGNYEIIKRRLKRLGVEKFCQNRNNTAMHCRKEMTWEKIAEEAKTCYSFAELLSRFGYSRYGGTMVYKVKALIKKHNIDISHFTGQLWSKGKTLPKKDVNYYLTKDSERAITTNSLRQKLLAQGIKDHRCEKCNGTDWQSQKMPLELHHIDGDRHNNTLDNIQLLCPNCHALTDNYRGKNKSRVGGI
jgi:hypothetical protein